jgi:hypothetical protein
MTETETTSNEKKSLSLAAFILSLIGLFCAFFSGWRTIGGVLGILGIIVAGYSITRTRGATGNRGMAVSAIIASVLALGIAGYFLFVKPAPPIIKDVALPPELTDSSSLRQDEDASVNQLKNLIDTSEQK